MKLDFETKLWLTDVFNVLAIFFAIVALVLNVMFEVRERREKASAVTAPHEVQKSQRQGMR